LTVTNNQLIELLPPPDQQRLLARCELVELSRAEVLCTPGDISQQVYFPIQSFISLMARVDGHSRLEVGMVGSEGMLGAHLALGQSIEPWHALVQGGGSALRISAKGFCSELARSKALQHTLNSYLYVQMLQLATSATCLRFHLISQRLARWLLMSQDRAHSNVFYVTHEFLATMLGVRRVGVTIAAGALQRDGLIEYHRGKLTVLNRSGLEAAACSCYASNGDSYHSVMH
jgi:CRP-like cAMP-binding protein